MYLRQNREYVSEARSAASTGSFRSTCFVSTSRHGGAEHAKHNLRVTSNPPTKHAYSDAHTAFIPPLRAIAAIAKRPAGRTPLHHSFCHSRLLRAPSAASFGNHGWLIQSCGSMQHPAALTLTARTPQEQPKACGVGGMSRRPLNSIGL